MTETLTLLLPRFLILCLKADGIKAPTLLHSA